MFWEGVIDFCDKVVEFWGSIIFGILFIMFMIAFVVGECMGINIGPKDE